MDGRHDPTDRGAAPGGGRPGADAVSGEAAGPEEGGPDRLAFLSASVRRPSPWRQFIALLGRDVRQELRSREMLGSMGVYSLLVLVVFGTAFSQGAGDVRAVSGGMVWAMLVFTSLLGLNRSFLAEREEGGLEGTLLAPLDRSLVFLAKAASNLVFLLVVEAVACPLYHVLFLSDAPPAATLPLVAGPLLAGSLGIAGVGTLLSTITSASRGRDVLLATLFVPVAFPLLHAVVSATGVALLGGDVAGVYVPGMALALGYDVVMVSLSWLLYDFVLSS